MKLKPMAWAIRSAFSTYKRRHLQSTVFEEHPNDKLLREHLIEIARCNMKISIMKSLLALRNENGDIRYIPRDQGKSFAQNVVREFLQNEGKMKFELPFGRITNGTVHGPISIDKGI
jgi:hypothetical protein